MQTQKPLVMCISGLDPSGGAGIQADIESLFSLGCQAAPIISALTVQDSRNVMQLSPCPADTIDSQARAVLEDMRISCFKLGLLADLDVIDVVATLLKQHPDIPVVLDPILIAGGGFEFGDSSTTQAIKKHLLPLTTVLTPNSEELEKLAATSANQEIMAAGLIKRGCQHVLVTGTHNQSKDVENTLYSLNKEAITEIWPRLEGSYHGSGCTLASAVAAGLAQGHDAKTASSIAQEYTWHTLKNGYKPGSGQHFPNRGYRQQYDK